MTKTAFDRLLDELDTEILHCDAERAARVNRATARNKPKALRKTLPFGKSMSAIQKSIGDIAASTASVAAEVQRTDLLKNFADLQAKFGASVAAGQITGVEAVKMELRLHRIAERLPR